MATDDCAPSNRQPLRTDQAGAAAAGRDRFADDRDRIADERETVADEREDAYDVRE